MRQFTDSHATISNERAREIEQAALHALVSNGFFTRGELHDFAQEVEGNLLQNWTSRIVRHEAWDARVKEIATQAFEGYMLAFIMQNARTGRFVSLPAMQLQYNAKKLEKHEKQILGELLIDILISCNTRDLIVALRAEGKDDEYIRKTVGSTIRDSVSAYRSVYSGPYSPHVQPAPSQMESVETYLSQIEGYVETAYGEAGRIMKSFAAPRIR